MSPATLALNPGHGHAGLAVTRPNVAVGALFISSLYQSVSLTPTETGSVMANNKPINLGNNDAYLHRYSVETGQKLALLMSTPLVALSSPRI